MVVNTVKKNTILGSAREKVHPSLGELLAEAKKYYLVQGMFRQSLLSMLLSRSALLARMGQLHGKRRADVSYGAET